LLLADLDSDEDDTDKVPNSRKRLNNPQIGLISIVSIHKKNAIFIKLEIYSFGINDVSGIA